MVILTVTIFNGWCCCCALQCCAASQQRKYSRMFIQQKQHQRSQANGSADGWCQAKLCCLLVLLLGDLLLNSSAEYDDFAAFASSASSDSKPQLIAVMILGVQLLLQVAVLLSLFVMMFDTWPFKAGLMGLLVDQYKWGLCCERCLHASHCSPVWLQTKHAVWRRECKWWC
jgi:hypothetical protein